MSISLTDAPLPVKRLSTARIRVKPRSWKYRVSDPAIEPPAPVSTIRSSFWQSEAVFPVLPKVYTMLGKSLLTTLIRLIARHVLAVEQTTARSNER